MKPKLTVSGMVQPLIVSTISPDKIASLDRRYKSKNIGLTAKLDQIADLLKKLSAVQCKLSAAPRSPRVARPRAGKVRLTSLNAQLGAVTQEVTLMTDEQEELLTAHEALKLKRDSLTEQVEELTESVALARKNYEVRKLEELGGWRGEQATIAAKDHKIAKLTEELDRIKMFQQQLEEKVADFEQVVSEKDEVETQMVQAQNELKLLGEERSKLVTEIEKLTEEKADVYRRLIQ
ncbi:hypothetical protein pipiens_011452 [Culex pipiens pipiens]|uniref:Uncharacterized protein n=1 Tax=Culex pipiens pipiens TaxID=38569 RepID=A0ABD1D6S6_CULPP